MNTIVIDNSDKSRLNKVVTWQFDQAENLCKIIDSLILAFNGTTKEFWDEWLSTHTNIDYADDFGLSVFGVIVGVPRPAFTVSGIASMASTELYRKIIKAQLTLLGSHASIADYCEYVAAIFGASNVEVKDRPDGNAMTLDFISHFPISDISEERYVFEQCFKSFVPYPAGVREKAIRLPIFGFDGQQRNRTSTDPVVGGFNDSGLS